MTNREFAEFDDVQGIVRYGHGQLRASGQLLLRIKSAQAAARWLTQAPVTSAEAVSPPPERVLQVAFSAFGLYRLGLPEGVLAQFSDEFLAGMTGKNRSRRLGDAGANDPEKWSWGGTADNIPDLVLLIYARIEDFDDYFQSLKDDELFRKAFELRDTLLSNYNLTREPFGFADGISQPYLDWGRGQTSDVHRRDTYSNLLSLGEILLGYPNEYGYYTDRPLVAADALPGADRLPSAEDDDGLRDLGRNGSYLVLRQLEQDVQGFWRFMDRQSGGDNAARERLAAAMVGRQRDGTPLVPPSADLIEGVSEKRREMNNFNFESDANGLACPIASHVRRSNPRTGDFPPGISGLFSRLLRILGFVKANRDADLVASTRFHRILRRGRQYGPEMSPEEALATSADVAEARGLHFVCLSANIARQFEFVQNAWSVNSKFAGLQNEGDPITGNALPLRGGSVTNSFSQPQPSGVRRCTNGLPRFVTVRGGAYLFLPGLKALRFIAAQAKPTSGSTHSVNATGDEA